MKKTIALSFIFLFSITTNAQYFQKAFGVNTPNQQELYDFCIDGNGDFYTAGTFRNIDYFPEPNFYGMLSKINSAGDLLWSKAYLFDDAIPFDSLLINSIVQTDGDSLFAFATLLGNTAENTGYCLIKMDNNGNVAWTKFIANELDVFTDLVYSNNALYAILLDRIIKFDLEGNVVNSIKIDLLFNIRLRKACATASGNIVVTGEAFIDSYPGAPVLTLDANLNLVKGYMYKLDQNGALFGDTIIEAANNKIIVGASGNVFCIDNSTGQILWSKIVQNAETPTTLDGLVNLVGIKALNASNTEFYATFSANYFDDQTNLLYIATAKLDDSGNFSGFKAIKQTPFVAIDNYHNPYAIEVDPQNNSYFLAGNLIAKNQDTNDNYHLNYFHKGALDQFSCGEQNISQNFVVDATVPINLGNFPANLIVPVTVQPVSKTLIVSNITPDYNNTYCIDASLSIPDLEQMQLSITPNPAQKNLHINTNQTITEIVVYDALGKKIAVPINQSNVLDVSDLAKGIYFIKITGNKGHIISTKFIKE